MCLSLSLVGVILDPPELLLPVAGGQWEISSSQSAARQKNYSASQTFSRTVANCGFFYFCLGRYFGTGPDSDLMMAPDDGSRIMTHPEGKGEKKVSVWLFYCSCNPTAFISSIRGVTLIQLADLLSPSFQGHISDDGNLPTTAFPIMQSDCGHPGTVWSRSAAR